MDKLWKQITQSDYAWEREALEFARQLLPDHDPYRAWANFEFIAQDGSINEVGGCSGIGADARRCAGYGQYPFPQVGSRWLPGHAGTE